jgi:hypothetical protein
MLLGFAAWGCLNRAGFSEAAEFGIVPQVASDALCLGFHDARLAQPVAPRMMAGVVEGSMPDARTVWTAMGI